MADAELKVALLAGASGLVGTCALDALLAAPDFGRVFAVTRRPLGREHPRLANRIVQFDRLEAQLKGITCHVALCALGTTIRQAGSQADFRQIDLDYVLAFARAAKAAQAQRFVVISSVGADADSKTFYLRTKGEMEEALAAVGFASLDILQPSLLLGWRSQMRPLELLLRVIMPLVNPLLLGAREAYRAVAAPTVGAAMLGATRSGRRGVQRYTYSGIQALSRLKPARTVGPADSKAPGGAK
ncbi:MAG: NAD-dependent epimerase/dehydratase family protein [Gammaproteobacteria bacterium]|nr:MAG: NAD-dependent epimerase/dehydratase family protein [Gammaproteobacteria bacterium]